MKCWGYNGPGQIGDRTNENRHLPRDVVDIHGEIVSVSLGATHSCALLDGGKDVKCWGHNFNGQLGEDSFAQYRQVPASVPGVPPGVKALAAGNDHTCALTDDSVWCWGSNQHGQFGNGGTRSTTRPVRAFGLKD
jgi:alpha-tubulin suppressor-like RCC1 family protein